MTKYNYLTDNELCDMILVRSYMHTALEKELATRLAAANDYIVSMETYPTINPTYDEVDL